MNAIVNPSYSYEQILKRIFPLNLAYSIIDGHFVLYLTGMLIETK